MTQPTQAQAAQEAGIGLTTLKRYLDEPEFQTAYQEAVAKLLEEASVQTKQGLNPALSCLREIVEDRKTAATARIQAARSLLEYGLRLTETVDIIEHGRKKSSGRRRARRTRSFAKIPALTISTAAASTNRP